jgi:hypothetical protein
VRRFEEAVALVMGGVTSASDHTDLFTMFDLEDRR